MTTTRTGPHLSHLVLNVNDLDASHHFYSEVLGFSQCAQLKEGNRIGLMRFYRGDDSTHHDLALVQTKEEQVDPGTWSMIRTRVGINHIAIAYPSREAWLARIAHIQASGVPFIERGDHGMTHSIYIQDPDGNGIEVLYDLPDDVWSQDVNAAINYYVHLPREGDAALADSTDYFQFEDTAETIHYGR